MCNHHYLVELRPDAGAYETWQDLYRVDGLGDAARRRAMTFARRYAIAHPDQAQSIVVDAYDCNGLREDAPNFVFAGQPAQPDTNADSTQALCAENVALRQELAFYAEPAHWAARMRQDADGQIVWHAPAADGGQHARHALDQ